MIDLIGTRQKELLKALLRNKEGLTVEELSSSLGITRNAVRQHLAALEKVGLVKKSARRLSGGRPEQLYVLTDQGHDVFPRHYAWFAQMLIEMIELEAGEEGAGERLSAMGERVAAKLRANADSAENLDVKVQKLAVVMEELGYDVKPGTGSAAENIPVIEASNCVFHELAKKHPLVCKFDLALLSTFTDATIAHEECMARGGNVCRFRFESK